MYSTVRVVLYSLYSCVETRHSTGEGIFTQTFRLRTGGLSVVRKASVNDLSVKKKNGHAVSVKKKNGHAKTHNFFYGHSPKFYGQIIFTDTCPFYGHPVRFTDTKTDSLRTKNGAPLPPY